MGFRIGWAAVLTVLLLPLFTQLAMSYRDLSRLSMAVPKHQPLHPPLPKGTVDTVEWFFVEWFSWRLEKVSNGFFDIFLWSGSDSKTLELAARSSSKLRTPGAPIVELPGAMDSGLDCAFLTSTVSDCVSLSGANQEQYFSMARLPFFLLSCQLRIQNDSFESQCTAPWSILIHLDPSGWFPFCSRWTGWEWAHFDRLSWRR